MNPLNKQPDGATPLDSNELEGLIPRYISTRGELNILEQENILEGEAWVKNKKKDLLTEVFFRRLHREMFKNVWKWAGEYRKTGKNIGVVHENISTELKKLCDDVQYWIKYKTYSWDEIGAHFHHRLVVIHPFPNGNGRFARLMTDALLESNGQKSFSWGLVGLECMKVNADEVRKNYLAALRDADDKRFE
ncbi:MAG: mobile mystery protein B, partial [Bdellovibrionales bacterium]|nr:mobile mystery protein B [Bdellovibrionales bacterium]